MPASKHCPDCGFAIPSDAPEGLCPRCLAGLASGSGAATEPCAGESFGGDVPEMAALFPEFEVVEWIGRGGMGVVYLVRQPELGRLAALKVLDPRLADEEGFRRRFRNEARTLAALNHPNIVTIYDFGERGGLFYFLMEYVDGGDLGRVLHATPLSSKEVLAIVRQICDAVECAHNAGVVHRDLKPGNILLDRQGRVKVADFGVAKLVGATDAGVPGTYIVGTPAYMAPEQRDRSTEVDHRADIYSLGAVFYELLTGSPPGEKLEPPSVRRVEIDVRLDKVVLRALERQPELRYQQVSELRTGVERIEQPRKPPVLSLVLGVTAVVMAAAAVWFHQAGRRAQEDPLGPPAWVNSLGMDFRPIPGADVLLATHETRVRDWEAFRRSGRAPQREVERIRDGHGPPDPDHPVTIDELLDAEVFCRWLTQREWDAGHLPRDQVYRLPTDREWSLAAGLREPEDGDPATLHLADQTRYPWGPELPAPPQGGNYPDTSLRERIPTALAIPSYHDGYAAIAPVQQFAPNAAGFHDLGGNLWEMVTASASNEMGTVLYRGGSWFSGSRDGDWRCLLSSFRAQPESVSPYERGFRVVRAPLDPTRAPTLLEASRAGDVDGIRRALARQSPANARDRDQCTPLHHIASLGAVEAIAALLEAGADPHAADASGRTALHAAAEAGSLPAVQALLDAGANPSARTYVLRTEPIHAAAAADAPDVLAALVAAGARIDGAGTIRSALHEAASAGAAGAVEWLADHGADVNQRSTFQMTPLGNAAVCGHAEICGLLLARGANPNAIDEELSPLAVAVGSAHADIVEMLLAHGADPGHPSVALELTTNLGSMLNQGRYRRAMDELLPGMTRLALLPPEPGAKVRIARLLVDRGFSLEQRDAGGMTPLLSAAYHGQFEVLQALLEAGADPSAVDGEGFSALHSAAEQGFPRIVEMLLAGGGDPEAKTLDGRTALFCAALTLGDRALEVVQLLLDRGADVDASDNAKSTVLMQAAARGNPAVVELLLERGADPNAQGVGGGGALSLAAAGPRSLQTAAAKRKARKTLQGDRTALLTSEPLGSEEDYARCVELLLAAGANPRAQDESGRTALSYAAQFDQVRSLELLLDAGVSPEVMDREALTPLHWAARGEAPGAAELLLERGALIATPLNPMTPLHEAARQGNRRVAELLLDRGADPSARDGKAATPLHWAVLHRRAAMVRVLVTHGADLEARDFSYSTPLVMAMAQPEEEVLRALIEAGANPRARGLDGLRAVDLAKVRQRLDLVGILDPDTPNILKEEAQARE